MNVIICTYSIQLYFNEYLGNNYKFLEQSKHWVSWHSTHKLDNELMPKPFLNVPQSFVVLSIPSFFFFSCIFFSIFASNECSFYWISSLANWTFGTCNCWCNDSFSIIAFSTFSNSTFFAFELLCVEFKTQKCIDKCMYLNS